MGAAMKSHPEVMRRRSGALLALVLSVALTSASGAAATRQDGSAGAPEVPAADAAAGELADIAFNLDYDIERIFRFVADGIRYEPYPGILRGARGTLGARAGNSVDQALLLAALLDESAVPYRFAHGQLDDATTAALIDSITTDAADARRIGEEALARGLDELLGSGTDTGTADGPLAVLREEEARASAAAAEARVEVAESRLDETVTMIETALDEVGIGLPADGVSLPPAEVVDHTWLQVPFGAGWLDLDPTLAAAEPGTVMTTADGTLDRLPDDLRHRVGFEVLVERVQGGRLVTDTVLEYAAFADEIAGVPIAFSHLAPATVERFGLTLLNMLGDGRLDYRPTLDIGRGSLVADEPVAFGLAGLEGGGGLLEGSDLFSDGASPSDAAGPPAGEATAEWLTVSVTQPGSEPAVARRTVFDRLPAHLRQGGEATVDAVEPIELIDFDGTGSTDFLPMLGIEAFAIATGPTSIAEILAMLPDNELGTAALAYHGLRDAMGAGMAVDAGARTFVDGPNIVSFSLRVGEPAQVANVRFGLDLWHRNHGILPLTGSSMTVAEAELVAGVTGHIAERVALEGLADARDVTQPAVGVGVLFEAAAIEGVPTAVLRGTIPDPLPYGPMATALIEEAVGSGDVVIVPAQPVIVDERERVGWWRIDPATGVTTDVLDDASGSEAAEYEVQMGQTMRYYRCNGPLSKYVIAIVMLQRFFGGSIAALDQGAFDKFVRPRGPGRTNCWTFTVVG
jgi:hypothetical protein